MQIQILNNCQFTKYSCGNIIVTCSGDYHLVVCGIGDYGVEVVDLETSILLNFDTIDEYESIHPTERVYIQGQAKLLLGEW